VARATRDGLLPDGDAPLVENHNRVLSA
jgi:hypothetical protein